MAYLDPKEAFENLQTSVLEGIRSQFPDGKLKGRTQSLHLLGLEVKDGLDPDDLEAQHKAKVTGQSWSAPVYGTFAIRRNDTGELIDQKRLKIAEIPKMTRRYSYIVDGREYQVYNQWQLKPGVYTRRRDNGQLECQFNVVGRRSFDVHLDPESLVFRMEYKKAKIPLYNLLNAMGVQDGDMLKAWGKQVFEANKNARAVDSALESFYRTDRKNPPSSKEEAAKHFVAAMERSQVRPDATEATLGKAFTNVTGDTFLRATRKLIQVHGGAPGDDRDSLVFKDLRTAGDLVKDRLQQAMHTSILPKIERKLNAATDVRDVIKHEFFNTPIRFVFGSGHAAAGDASQINPVEMVSTSLQTTIMGPGGIKSDRSVSDEAKFINPSHIGFLDPINTPEGPRTGVTLRLPVGVKKVGHEPQVRLYNLKTKKLELVGPSVFHKSQVVLPDQISWEKGVPKPLFDTVKAAVEGNEIRDVPFSNADYVLPHSWQLFNMTSNLIPFMANNSGGRASMASRHIEQAISLVHREPPLVQVGTGNPNTPSFEATMKHQIAHPSPVDGTIVQITPNHILVRDHDGKDHKTYLYNHYPLNESKSTLHSTPLEGIKVGTKVKKDQVLADTNFSKNGTLALGTNLRVAYIPFRGYNFEDGVVISESAQKKLSSGHLHKNTLNVDDKTVLSKKDFVNHHFGMFNKDQLAKMDEHGVVHVGQRVKAGDPLVLATKPFEIKDRVGLAAIRKKMSDAHTDKSMRWDSDFEGEVIAVHKAKDGVTVHVKTVEPMQIGDKITGRSGNKGIVVKILPDAEMPRTKDGRHVEVALNSSGVPGRMNVGQILETSVSKIAEKTGKTYYVQNFGPPGDTLARVRKELKDHSIPETEELYDPVTKQSLGHATVGPQYMLKLKHQVESKVSARSGMPLLGAPAHEHYDTNLQPASGSGTGGQSMGTLGLYALLAHGARANIREMQAYKTEGPDPQTHPAKRWRSLHDDAWAALQTGGPLPLPQPTFAFQKFTDYLRAAGINIDKHGHELSLTPMTNEQILKLAPKALPKPTRRVLAKLDPNGNPKPEPGGLFDEHLTGGHGGRNWTRIPLAEPVPNPIFATPIQSLLGISAKQYQQILHGELAVTPNHQLTDVLSAGTTGGPAITQLLKTIDVKKELPKAEKELRSVPRKGTELNKALKRVKYLRALDKLGASPEESYVLKNLPVLPPIMRPVSLLTDGKLRYDDITQLYADFAKINEKLADPVLSRSLPEEKKGYLRKAYYDGISAIFGAGTFHETKDLKGVLHTISGVGQPKLGFFQKTLINRRQDMTMRSTIIPEPAMGLDEVGLPRDAALDLFRPFVVRELRTMGAIQNEMQAPGVILKKTPDVWRALDRVVEKTPVLLKRDPALHKYSVQAFKPRIVHGNAIQIHPLVTGGYNADFDGDQMSVFVPITSEAVSEAYKMMPSRNIFSEASGVVAYQPTLESALGLFKLSRVVKDTGKKFKDYAELLEAAREKKVDVTDIVHVGGTPTTAGRALLAAALPEKMQHKVLTDLSFKLDKNGLSSLLHDLGKGHPEHFGTALNVLKDLGNGASFGAVPVPKPASFGHGFQFHTVDGTPVATHDLSKTINIPIGTHSLSLQDFVPDKEARDPVLRKAHAEVQRLNADKALSQGERDHRAIQIYQAAEEEIHKRHFEHQKKDPSNLFLMLQAKVKPDLNQYKQMVLAPMIYKDSANRPIPTPVTKSYSEGFDVGSYWTQMHGARRGTVMKVQEVQEPGVLSKLLVNNTMNLLISSKDCGTKQGIAMSVASPDIHDRHLAHDFTHGSFHLPAGTLLSPDIVGQIRKAKKDAELLVRSPVKCEEAAGICQTCAGLSSGGQPHPLGTNIGIHAAHAIGERAVQLRLKEFHCMHEHSLVLVRSAGRVLHTTLGAVFQEALCVAVRDGEEIRRPVEPLEVWDNGGWVRVKSARRHIQMPGTSMLFTRTRAGYGIISQDNHPHMLRENTAVCSTCGTFPKRERGGRYSCRKCGHRWEQLPQDDAVPVMVEPADIQERTHRAVLDTGPAPTEAAPPLHSGWLAGIYCAEGTIHCQNKPKEYEIGIQIGQKQGTDTYGRIRTELLAEFPDANIGLRPNALQLYGRERALFFQKEFGRYSRNVGLPAGWSGYSKEWLLDFLSGVFDGDGTVTSAEDSFWKVGRIDTTSFLLAQQAHWILRSVGINARILLTPWRQISRHQGYAVTFVVTEAAKRLLSSSSKLASVTPKPEAHEERFRDVVDYIRPVAFGAPPYVYDLETESGTLFVGGVWTHNTGGATSGAGTTLVNAFTKLHNLTSLPKSFENQASLAMVSGKVEKIENTPTGVLVQINGKKHHVGKDTFGLPLHKPLPNETPVAGWTPPTVGAHYKAGDHLSDPGRTYANPHDLYKATKSMDEVQRHLVTSIHDLYASSGVKQKHVETIVRAMGNLTRVTDAGDHHEHLRGEFAPLSKVKAINKELIKAGKTPIEHEPTLKGIDVMPLELVEDWMAKLQHRRLRGTIIDGAATGAVSNIHGPHPIPGIAYGAEFGLSQKDSKRIGLEHLKNVPDHIVY